MSDTQISFMFIFWSVSVLIAQIPCGLLSDRYSRKNIIIFGQISKALSFFVWLTIPTFGGYMLGFFLWGIQWATLNCAYEALVYEELKSLHSKKLYCKICGVSHATGITGYVLSSAGSFLLPWGYGVITWLSILSLIISACFAIGLKVYSKPQTQQTDHLKIIKHGIGIFKKSPKTFFTMIMLTSIIGLAYIDEYFGLIGLEMGVDKRYVGIIFAAVLITESIGGYIAHHFEERSDRFIYTGIIVLGLTFISIFLSFNIFGILLLAVFYLFYSVLRNLLFSRFQHSIASKSRGIVLGFYSISEQFSSILSYIAMMVAANIGGYRYGFLILGVGIIILGAVYLICDSEPKASEEAMPAHT